MLFPRNHPTNQVYILYECGNTTKRSIDCTTVHIVKNPPSIWIKVLYRTWYSKTFVDKNCTAPPPAGAPAAVGHPENNIHQSETSTSLPVQQIRAQIALA